MLFAGLHCFRALPTFQRRTLSFSRPGCPHGSKESAHRTAETCLEWLWLTPGVFHSAYRVDGFPDYFPRHAKVLLNCGDQFSTICQRPYA